GLRPVHDDDGGLQPREATETPDGLTEKATLTRDHRRCRCRCRCRRKPTSNRGGRNNVLQGRLLQQPVNRIDIGRPRETLVSFNTATKDWVNTREEAPGLTVYQGNMTRYNSLSRNGRAFIDQLERVVPVRPDGDFPAGDLGNLTWSLHGSNTGTRNKLLMRVRPVTSASGQVKRLLLSDCQAAPEE
ncbi:hypothetical protein, partial [Paracoccus halophilus]|uniref:hypothetical protein n=1 Tax=Paracoccus halophilus TaxID=376733 RepID=UPI001E320AFB